MLKELQSIAHRAADIGSIAKNVAYSSVELAATAGSRVTETAKATGETIRSTADRVGITKNFDQGNVPLLCALLLQKMTIYFF